MLSWFKRQKEKYRRNTFFHFRYIGSGIYNDIKNRIIKYYVSDIKDGITYRTIPSTIFIFFTNLLPAIAFAQDMFDHTDNSYGLNEVLLSSAMGGIVFGLVGGSPLCIVGVTGPISIFNYTVYEIINPVGIPYFQFMCWICLWSMLFHFILAISNSANFMRYVTKFSCDVFGFFINVVYIQKGIQILTNQFKIKDVSSGFASIVVATVMAMFGIAAHMFGTKSHYISRGVRVFIKDYGTPLCVVFFTGFIHFGGYLDDVDFAKLPITKSFSPTDTTHRGTDWFIRFWKGVTVGNVFLAVPFAILLTSLFYYDHNISSLICQSSEFPLKKPASFHYDLFLLGITTGVAGLLGIPAPNGLIPQAPLHTYSLCIYEYDEKRGINRISKVVEQRLTNTLQGLMTIGMMTRPLLVVLGTIPQCVLAGLFWIMAITTIDQTDVVKRLRFLFLDDSWKQKLMHIVLRNYEREQQNELEGVSDVKDEVIEIIPSEYPVEYYLSSKKYFSLYLGFELFAFAAEFGITNTKGAIGFPGVLMLILILVPIFFPRIFPKKELDLLDSEAADELILQSLRLNVKKEETDEDDLFDEEEGLTHIHTIMGR